jgi:hypothetical protein
MALNSAKEYGKMGRDTSLKMEKYILASSKKEMIKH